MNSPIQGFPKKCVPATALKAQVNIIPSKPILIIPPLSENIPPRAAKAIGVANLIADANNPTVIISKISVIFSSPFIY